MNEPKVSILLPAYNHEKYLQETIESVLNQTFSDFELLISDDCSTDNTAQIIKEFSDKRITRVFFDENRGTVRALNHLLSIAKGEYIAVIGSDDIWELDKLEKQLEILESDKGIAACFSWATIIDENSDIVGNDSTFPVEIFNFKNYDRTFMLRQLFVNGNHLCHSSVLIRSDIHRQIGEYNVGYRQLHDYDLWVRLLLSNRIHIMELPLVKYRFIENSGNVSQNCEKNNFRLWNEGEEILLHLIENISDEDFVKGFREDLTGLNGETATQIACEKFLILRKFKLWGLNNNSLALRFLFKHLDGEMLKCLERDYSVSLCDIYDYTSVFKSAYYAEVYEQCHILEGRCLELQKELEMQHNVFQKRLEEIYSSSSWKLTRPLRVVMDKMRKR